MFLWLKTLYLTGDYMAYSFTQLYDFIKKRKRPAYKDDLLTENEKSLSFFSKFLCIGDHILPSLLESKTHDDKRFLYVEIGT